MKRLILGIFLVVWWCGNLVCAQDIAVKTNLLYWATSTPNIGFEFGLGKRTTLDLVGGYNPWTLNKDDNKKIKHWMVMPEFRNSIQFFGECKWFGVVYRASGATLLL